MTWDIAAILAMDGLATSAIYLLAGMGMVLVFSVTRVLYVPFGDIAAFSALTLAAFFAGKVPATILMVAVLALLAGLVEMISLLRGREYARMPMAALVWWGLPLIPCALAWAVAGSASPLLLILVTVILVIPIAPLTARIVFQPIADASVLVLLIVSLALHFVMTGLGLLFFGPEGSRTPPLANGIIDLGAGILISGQTLLVIGAAVVFAGLFFVVFETTFLGKVLRATAINRTGARLVGIRPARTALLAYGIASMLAAVIGILISPGTTIYYDSGFSIGLKAFVGATIGGLASYPLTAFGALLVGLVESFAAFWSGAMKDVIVFTLLIPALLIRSIFTHDSFDDHEEEAE